MKEKEYLEYLEYLKGFGSKPGLLRIKELLRRLGNPEEKLNVIHIAGTNGKGSILAMLSSVLTAHGKNVGVYTSPAVFDYRERFTVKGKMITKKALGEYFSVIRQACDEMTAEGFEQPTAFEAETALAFLYFYEKKANPVLIETGMGGKEDATNVVSSPILTIFASIGEDHMEFLGSTLSAIAKEKAGILKEDVPAVSSVQREEVVEVLKAEAKKRKVRLTFADRDRLTEKPGKKPRFDYETGRDCYKNITLSLLGSWQYENAMTVLEALSELRKQGMEFSDAIIRDALKHTVWPGRMEKIASRPDVYIDGAHNLPAAKELAKTVSQYFTNRQIIYIIGVLKDKDYEGLVEQTVPYAEAVITVKCPDNPRALDSYTLAQCVSRYHSRVMNTDSVEEAVEMAYLLAGNRKDVMILAFGSLSYLGRLKRVIEKERK